MKRNVSAICFYLAAIFYLISGILYLRRNAAYTVLYLSLGVAMLCVASMESKRGEEAE